MGEEILLKYSDGTLIIDGCEVAGISDFEADFEAGNEYIEGSSRMIYNASEASFTATCKFNIIAWYKIIGWWGWLEENCPNKRVVWLMNHGRTRRVREKNLHRAFREIAKILKNCKGE